MAAKLTPEQQAIDRELNRINRQIRQAFATFGSNSRLAAQYTQLLTGIDPTGTGRINKGAPMQQYADMVRNTSAGIPQLSRSAKNIRLIQTGAVANAIMQLGRMQTVQEAKAATVKAYEQRTGEKVKGAKAKAAAVQAEIENYNRLQGRLGQALRELYKREREQGVRFRGHEEIKRLSKGRWTSNDDLDKMIEIAEQTAKQEDAAVIAEQDALAMY